MARKTIERTGTRPASVSPYERPVDSTHALSIDTDWLRTRSDLVNQEIRETQDEVRALLLSEVAYRKASAHNVEDLLQELSVERGLGWSDIALLTGVSVSAVRKWRKGGVALPESRRRLAEIGALLDILEEKNVPDPAQWMEMYLPLPAGYSIRPLDLYLKGHGQSLLELAEGLTDASAFLDRVEPGWRESRSLFEVDQDDEGARVLRLRGSGA